MLLCQEEPCALSRAARVSAPEPPDADAPLPESRYRYALFTRPEVAFRIGDRLEISDGVRLYTGRASDSFFLPIPHRHRGGDPAGGGETSDKSHVSLVRERSGHDPDPTGRGRLAGPKDRGAGCGGALPVQSYPLFTVEAELSGVTALDGGRQCEERFSVTVTAASDRDRDNSREQLAALALVLPGGIPMDDRVLHPEDISTKGDTLQFLLPCAGCVPCPISRKHPRSWRPYILMFRRKQYGFT